MNQPAHRGGRIASRRTFLKTSLVAGGALAGGFVLVPRSVMPRAGGATPANRITVGMIGTGRQAIHANIPGFLHQSDAQVVAVCDVDSWRMERARAQVEKFYAASKTSGQYRGCAAIPDWRELIERKDVDAVMISTPDPGT